MPADIYKTYFDKLKELMRRGVVIKPYHAYGPGTGEHFAFPGCNTFITDPQGIVLPLDDKEMIKQINDIGVEYYTYERFKGIENRSELTDEKKEICKRFYAFIDGKKVKRYIILEW
ncbi:MAG: hypothetical protein UHM16_05750 [Acutalibacteraceae bacterium]|nr:hypothetical protein [Acutalibacteraceae bacterium]